MITVLIVIIIHSIFRAIIENLGNHASSKMIYFIQYLIIVTLITDSFVSVIDLTRDSIQEIVNFMNLLIPLLSTLMLTTGCITTTGIIQPIILFMISFIGNFISNFLIPMLLISITLRHYFKHFGQNTNWPLIEIFKILDCLDFGHCFDHFCLLVIDWGNA